VLQILRSNLLLLGQGQYTAIVYGAIKDQRYADAVRILQIELQVWHSMGPLDADAPPI
jgi:hypothetical protein